MSINYDVILSPVITEKATRQTEANQVVFRVTLDATKPAIAKAIADLFAGCGTFALPLAQTARVHAVEQDGPALAALAAAAKAPNLKPVTTEVRDLFKLPLTPVELKPYDAVVLDPPRAGAHARRTGGSVDPAAPCRSAR